MASFELPGRAASRRLQLKTALFLFVIVTTGPLGNVLLRQEAAAAGVGISPVRFKLLAFVIGTGMAGLGGALYAHFMRFISATDFGFPMSVSLLSMIVVGGMGTLWGPLLGAVIIGVLPRRPEEGLARTWEPAVDVYETDKEFVLKAELPGVDPKDVEVRVEDSTLYLKGERKFEKETKEENYHRVERSYGTFTRSFSLPHTINTEQIHADYRNGVLTIRLPKREEAKPKQIKISVKSAK